MSSSDDALQSLTQPSPRSLELLRERAGLTSELHRRIQGTKLYRYQPYRKQKEFHAAGALHRERLLMAANQVGKTLAGRQMLHMCNICQAAFHLTGRYPDWWQGKRWNRPGVPDALDGVVVQHVSGGTSTLGFNPRLRRRMRATVDYP